MLNLRIGEIISFRKDLLFNGAVQIGWFEKDKKQAEKAAQHFIFHGPEYHGAAAEDFGEGVHKLVDTATFTADLLERISGNISDEPFSLAIAGYGTGKSHLGVTLASLLSSPSSKVSEKILDNISMADAAIGRRVKDVFSKDSKPYLVLTVNGMQDFDLTAEIVRQILQIINSHNLDTTVLENLRPRFKTAVNFTESFFKSLQTDFEAAFGPEVSLDEVVEKLKHQDDETFCRVNEIFEQKMSQPITATGQESLHDFIRVTKEAYCGEGKPFAGIVIIFDEFGRYLEFSVQKPHIAGSGALQKLFESVQENADKVFLLGFIQYELKAYISRVAPELRDDLNRYVTRFDSVRKIRLSTNLETLISNLLEKKNQEELSKQTSVLAKQRNSVQANMRRWFPDISKYSLWLDADRFERVILKGCWPMHPISTWIFYKLTTVGKSLQQRSALSLLADIINDYSNVELAPGNSIVPADLCNESLINEFLSSERAGQQGATAHAFDSVVEKYQHELSEEERSVLKSVLLTTKVGVKIDSRDEYVNVLRTFSGLDETTTRNVLHLLEQEYAVLAWNERLRQYEIVDDAVPRSAFIKQLTSRVAEIDIKTRANIFSQKYGNWSQNLTYLTDFGPQNNITTKEWNYKITYTSVELLNGQIDYTLRSWSDARGVDEDKGQLIYCYVGPDSNLDSVKELSRSAINNSLAKNKITSEHGAPLAVIFLHDANGSLGEKIAQYWVLEEQLSDDEAQKFSTFILNTKESTKQEIDNLFSELERNRDIVFATEKSIKSSRISVMLTYLFGKVYPEIIPFPFDGFHTARGNAAKDSQTFIKELFFGNLDREWISARGAQQRNRAYSVLDKEWGAIADNGSVRLKPIQPTIKVIFEELDNKLQRTVEQNDTMNLGSVIKELCAPPYGCNLASAGMILALFIGRRKGEINLYKSDEVISIDNWLQDAMPKNYLDISILDNTSIIKVSEDALSEWELLLEDWDAEKVYIKKVKYPTKAVDLENRIPVPQQLYYRYQLLQKSTAGVKEELNLFERKLEEALDKIENGIDKENISLLTWGADLLMDLKNKFYYNQDPWTKEQVDEVEENLNSAKAKIKEIFPAWLKTQTIFSLEHLGKFKHVRLTKVAPVLEKLGLTDEKERLFSHVEKVEGDLRHIAEIKQTASDIQQMVLNNVITNSTTLNDLNKWLEQVKELALRLAEARERTDLARDELDDAAKKLKYFKDKCKEQINSYYDRTTNLYNIDNLSSLHDIAYWRKEANSLLIIFQGHERDTEDLALVIKQLDLIENHLKVLNDANLTEDGLSKAISNCYKETETEFAEDAPPLDYESIYEGIINAVRANREQKAREWMKDVPEIREIANYDSYEAMSVKQRLLNIPPVLNKAQIQTVQQAVGACDDRIDELELDGMLARFETLSDNNKKVFLKRITPYLQKLTG
ncbi:hypothetical protein [Dethiobacter alkaliphilus]|uniref:hypothetical protein n=1 Tax=Dethiobacter alkaliphilus TaxID=427926 RepID=UPI0037BEC472